MLTMRNTSLQRRNRGDIDNVVGGRTTRQIVAGTRQTLNDGPDGLRAREARGGGEQQAREGAGAKEHGREHSKGGGAVRPLPRRDLGGIVSSTYLLFHGAPR